MTLELRWLASAAEKDGERGGRLPTVRHEHVLGLIERSHSRAEAQAEERICLTMGDGTLIIGSH